MFGVNLKAVRRLLKLWGNLQAGYGAMTRGIGTHDQRILVPWDRPLDIRGGAEILYRDEILFQIQLKLPNQISLYCKLWA